MSDIEEAVPENWLDLSDNEVEIDLFNDTAAIFKLLDLRNIMGRPGEMSTIRYTRFSIYARFSGKFFFKFS